MVRYNYIALALLFSLPPAAAQDEGIFEERPTDLLPLEVGNQWTYKQRYLNLAYSGSWWERNPEIRILFEVPGGYRHPPDSLLSGEREFTIEITHTEMIDGWEYFVFSHADYDWPPLPTLFWAGQKVRLSDEGVLLFRWNGQDVPLYDLNPQHPSRYSIPAYPLREDLVTKLAVGRYRHESQIGIRFGVTYPELNLPNNMRGFSGIDILVLPGYGLTCNESYYRLLDGSALGVVLWVFCHPSAFSISMTLSLFRRLFQEKRCPTTKFPNDVTLMFNRDLGVN